MIHTLSFIRKIAFVFLAIFLYISFTFSQEITVVDANTGRSNKSKGNGEVFSNSGFNFGLNAGRALPLDTLTSDLYASTGTSLSANIGYNWKNIGFSFEVGAFKNSTTTKVRAAINDSQIDLPHMSFFSAPNWQSNYFGVGPDFQTNNPKFNIGFAPRFGLYTLKTPDIEVWVNAFNSRQNYIILPEEKITYYYFSGGIDLSYQLTKGLKFHFNSKYFSTLQKSDAEYNYNYIQGRNITELNGIPGFQEEEFIESQAIERSTNLNPKSILFELGLSCIIGKKKKKLEQTTNTEHSNCFPVDLGGPAEESNFDLSHRKAREGRDPKTGNSKTLIFDWKEDLFSDSKASSHNLKVYNDQNKLIHQQLGENNQIIPDQKLKNILQQNKDESSEFGQKFSWEVESIYDDCMTQVSKRKSFRVKSFTTGINIDLHSIQCQSPAYGPNGEIKYSGTVDIFNNSSTSQKILISDIKVILSGTSVSINNLSPSTIANPLLPGQSASFQFEFEASGLTQNVIIRVPYQPDGNPNMQTDEPDIAALPQCICNVCDDWKILSILQNITKDDSASVNTELTSHFAFQNGAPIKEVKAEIISVDYETDEGCKFCIKGEEKMGYFQAGEMKSSSDSNQSDWAKNGDAFHRDDNGNGTSNFLTWQVSNPQIGVDGQLHFVTQLSLPDKNPLSCCNEKVRVCLRWSFTDINCQTCEKLVCYWYSSRKKDDGINPNRPRPIEEKGIEFNN